MVVAAKCVTRTMQANLLSDFSMLSDIIIDQATLSRMKAKAVSEETNKK